jgi:hypothetical protein
MIMVFNILKYPQIALILNNYVLTLETLL